MSYGHQIRIEFARAYARIGNAKKALAEVLGEERANRMKPHSLRARASELLNNYRTQELISDFQIDMRDRGEPLPRYRKGTYRTDLMS